MEVVCLRRFFYRKCAAQDVNSKIIRNCTHGMLLECNMKTSVWIFIFEKIRKGKIVIYTAYTLKQRIKVELLENIWLVKVNSLRSIYISPTD